MTTRPDQKTKIRTAMALNDLTAELERARAKFPSSELINTALAEEVGELAIALLEENMERVYREAIQVACCAIRLATEGDPAFNDFRTRRGLGIEIYDPR